MICIAKVIPLSHNNVVQHTLGNNVRPAIVYYSCLGLPAKTGLHKYLGCISGCAIFFYFQVNVLPFLILRSKLVGFVLFLELSVTMA